MTFEEELETLINKYSIENKSDTPDFILAGYLRKCLEAYQTTVKDRDAWHGFAPWGGQHPVTEEAP